MQTVVSPLEQDTVDDLATRREGHAVTTKIVNFLMGARYEHLPAAAITQAKLAILDTIGVTVAGVATATGQAMCQVAEDASGRAVSTIIGGGFKTDPASAALVNGTTGHALDYDDVSWTMIGHPSVLLLPAVLALAEERRARRSVADGGHWR